nr:protein unc-93 homolog A-like isoform X2 [Styela clava]XP_039254660.1 protein unc-93 homolog A-like isoform X2 [Styela clava]
MTKLRAVNSIYKRTNECVLISWVTEVMKMSEKHVNIRKNSVAFYIYALGYFLRIGPFVSVVGLQSSINIEKSIGTITLGVGYVVSVLTALFVTPVVIRRFGCKWAIVAGEVANLLYIAANFYPVKFIMVLAGAVVGLGEGLIWTTLPIFSTYFGIEHGHHGGKHRAEYIKKYTGIFFGFHYAGLVFGTAVSYGFLYGGKHGMVITSDAINVTSQDNISQAAIYDTSFLNNYTQINSTASFTNMNITFSATRNITDNSVYQYCGSNDCQQPEVTEMFINNYVPADKTYLHILLSLFCALTIFGIFLHIKFLPAARPQVKYENSTHEMDVIVGDGDGHQNLYQPTLKSSLIAIYRHNFNKLQLLIVPIVVYNGLVMGFYLSELGRAYTSCVLGVEQTGLSLMALSMTSAFSSVISGKLNGIFGRNIIMIILFVIDISNYMFCLWWKPQENTAGLVYLIFVVFGLTDACWKNNIIGMYTDYFPDNQEISFSVWNLWMTLGIAISFCWSPLLCVSTKIYAHCILLALSVLLCGFAECLHRRGR